MNNLSLRQYYAGQALQGFFSGFPFTGLEIQEEEKIELKRISELCWIMADEMIKGEGYGISAHPKFL